MVVMIQLFERTNCFKALICILAPSTLIANPSWFSRATARPRTSLAGCLCAGSCGCPLAGIQTVQSQVTPPLISCGRGPSLRVAQGGASLPWRGSPTDRPSPALPAPTAESLFSSVRNLPVSLVPEHEQRKGVQGQTSKGCRCELWAARQSESRKALELGEGMGAPGFGGCLCPGGAGESG